MRNIIVLLLFTILISSCGNEVINQEQTKKDGETILSTNKETTVKSYKYEEQDVVALIKTTNGTISILLETELAPRTTANFIGLSKQGYYDEVIFHRIIKGFMIQWGDPDGTGMWWTSIYWEKFEDEFHPDLKNNKYTISMANSWPNTNGSQFFINTANNNFLDLKHSVFGEVVEWLENVDKLEKTKTASWDRPEKEVKMISIDVKQYINGSLKDYEFDLESTLKKVEEWVVIRDEEAKKVDDTRKEANKDRIVKAWDNVNVHYTGTLEDGTKFDSSYDRNEPISFEVWAGLMIKGFDAWVVGMKIWDKKTLKLAPADAYGEYSEANVQVLKKDTLTSFTDNGIKLEVWSELPTQQWVFKIVKTDETTVTIDVNHALSWKTLNFDIELIDIK